MGEIERRRSAQFIMPGKMGVVNDDTALGQQPVDEAGLLVLRRIDFQPGHEKMTIRLAADDELWRLYGQLRQPRLQIQQRTPAYFGLDFIEAESRPAGTVADLEPLDGQQRMQTPPATGDMPDRYRPVHRAGQRCLDIATIIFDLRQNQVAQGEQ